MKIGIFFDGFLAHPLIVLRISDLSFHFCDTWLQVAFSVGSGREAMGRQVRKEQEYFSHIHIISYVYPYLNHLV